MAHLKRLYGTRGCRLLGGWLLFSCADCFLPRPQNVYLCAPAAAILISMAISAAITAASIGLEYLLAKKQKGQNVDRGKVDDIRASVPGYGEFIPKIWGIARVAPIWIWESPAVDHPVTTPGHSGGKGFGGKPTAAVTETTHVYLKSVAGVFHDGIIYGGVRRMWFDADLVLNRVPTQLSSQKYEAEFGVLAGGAAAATQAQCSGKRKVTGIGNGGTCTISVNAATVDSYEMAMHYTSSADLTFNVSVDGGGDIPIVCTSSGGPTIIAIEALDIGALTIGDHTIAFSNAAAAAPDLDYIDIVPAHPAGAIDTRSFTGLIAPAKSPPTNQNKAWAFNNENAEPNGSGGGGAGGGGGVQGINLGKYGQPSIRIYGGKPDQVADSALVAQEGATKVSAYRQMAYIVIEGIELQNGRMPNVTMEVDQGVHSLPAIVADIYAMVGITAVQLNLTALDGLQLGTTTIAAGTYVVPTYQNVTNATVGTGGAISKTSGATHTWNAHATSTASVASAIDGAVRFTASTAPVLIGFSTTAAPTVTTDVTFAVLLNTTSSPSLETKNAVQVWNGTAQSTDIGLWAPGDDFQVEIRNGRFRLYQNGSEIQSFIPSVAVFPLYPVVFMYDTNAGPSALTISTAGATGDAPSSDAGGLLLSSRRTAADLLAELQTRFQFDMVEVDGVVKAILRSGTGSDITIPYTDMRAVIVQPGSLPEIPAFDCEVRDIDPYLLPERVDVNYLDPGMDYHNNVQSEVNIGTARQDQQSVSLSIVDQASNMKALAQTLFHKAEMEGRAFAWMTSYKYMHVHPASIATLTLSSATHTVRVVQAKYNLPAGVIEFQGVRHAPSLYSTTATGSISDGFEPPIAAHPANTKGVIIDGPLLRAEDGGDGTQPIVYIAMCGRGSGAWNGAFFEMEFPRGSGNYQLITSSAQASQIGVSSGALATVSDPSVWDRTNTLVINFYTASTLGSVTEAELLANGELNLLAVVNPSTNDVEYIQFVTASAGAATTPYLAQYTVSTFLRGRFGTDSNVALHTAADDVVLIDSTIRPRRMNLGDIGL